MSGNRAKLVRARPKAIEHLPEWAKCCDKATEHMESDRKSDNPYVLDMSVSRLRTENVCRWCKAPWPEHKVYRDIVDGRFAAIDLLDLDEGPVNL